MNNRTFRALDNRPLHERVEEAAALAGHASYNHAGVATICRCTTETEHDSATGAILTLGEIVARKNEAS